MTPQMTEDPMEVVQKRAVDICFPDEPVRSLVLQVLKGAKEHLPKDRRKRTVDRLGTLVIKRLTKKEEDMRLYRSTSVYETVLHSLVFGEPLDIFDFHPVKNRHDHGFLDERDEVYCDLRKDPEIMLAVWQHNLPRVSWATITVQVRRFSLEISLEGKTVTSIEHPLESPFDTFWAKKFIRLLLLNSAKTVKVEYYDPYWMSDPDVMKNTIEGMIASLEPKIPAEGWEKAVESRTQTIYDKCDGRTCGSTQYSTTFYFDIKYDPSYKYWGYLE